MSSGIKSAERVMDVLRLLASRVRPVPSMTIAEHCNLPRSSAYHLLNCMQDERFVIYYPDQRAWGLGPSAFEVGSSYLRAEPLTWLGAPLLRRLAAACGATGHLAVLHGRDVLYTAKERPPERAPTLVSRVGLRLPAHLTAIGQAILMHLPDHEVRAILPSGPSLARRTPHGPTFVSELERELREGRERGYALERGMTTLGVTCLAATVFSHENRPVAGLGVAYASPESAEFEQRTAQAVVATARELSTSLGWPGDDPPR